jgi:uncharacterized repeat protein (TIGR02543 family)
LIVNIFGGKGGIMKKKFRFAKIVLMLVLCLSLTLLTACKPEAQEFTVSFDSDGGSVISSQTVEKGESINLPVPEKQGFVFDGWYENELKVATPFVVNKDTSLKAKWNQLPVQPVACTVNFDVDGGNAIDSLQKTTGDVIDLPLPTKAGYVFDALYIGSTKVSGANYTLTGDVTFKAKWLDKNPAYDYNYYEKQYNFSKSSKIKAINSSDLDEMMTTSGEWVIFIDSETGLNAQSRFNMVNDFAHEWGITIHHFNPDLAGGFASYNQNGIYTPLIF